MKTNDRDGLLRALEMSCSEARPLAHNAFKGPARQERGAAGHPNCSGDALMSIGQPLPRPDGRAKVTGAARYAADQRASNPLYAMLVTATIPAGRVSAIDASKAREEPGVRVLTHADMPRLGKLEGPPIAQSFMPMQGDEVRYQGQPIAVVLGDTLEAEAAARRVVVRYESATARLPAPHEWTAIDKGAVARGPAGSRS